MKKSLLSLSCLLWILVVSVQAQSRFKTVNYLNSITGKYILSGQHNDQKTRYNGTPTNENYWTNMVQQITGKYPALYSADFLFAGNGPSRWAVTYEAERQWNAGAAVNFMWHTCPPTQNSVCGWDGGVISSLNASQWNELLTNGTNLNSIWKSRIDEISVYLQYLEDKGVEVLWRPLHEQNQTVFWWNSGGAGNTKALWKLTHDYMTNTKGLSNLIWVWDIQDLSTNFSDYNPGAGYYDIAALDIYGDGHTNYSYYNALQSTAAGKPIAMGETFKVPTAAELNNTPNYSFFMVWAYGLFEDYNSPPNQTNTNADIQACYNNPRVLTRDEMPGWNTVSAPANLATGKPITVSSTEAGANSAANAVDGSYSTRWSSLYSDSQWLSVDLGANYSINRVKITWEAAYGKDYTVQISSDGTNWTTIKSISGNTTLVNDHTTLTGSGRYVRINGSARGTAYGYSIYELEVYGTTVVNLAPTVSIASPANNASFTAPASIAISANAADADGFVSKVDFYNGATLLGSDNTVPYTFSWTNVASGTYSITAKATDNAGAVTTSVSVLVSVNTVVIVPANLATGKSVTASSTETSSNNVASNAVDGTYATRWSSSYSDPQWLSVDLGANYNINRVKITWEAAYGKDYTVQLSTDGTNWTTIKSISGNTTLVNDHTALTGNGRYVRINGTARGTVYGYSIYEVEVYGTPAVNIAPTVSITSPTNNASFIAPASITIAANASDADGSVSKVDFYNGTALLGSDNTAPYSYSWSNVAAGNYSITAKVTDNSGAVTTSAASSIVVTNPVTTSSTKVIAYIANWIDLNAFSNTIDYSKLTHINVAFENPNSNGDLSFNNGDNALIQKAHANNVKIFVSIGGGSASEDATTRAIYFNLISDAKRASFVSKIAAYIQSHNFDGIDVDLEGPAINGDYGKFITDLSNALKPAGKGVSAALSQGYGGGNVPSTTFPYFDFINIMAYDATGPWDPSNPGQHSSYDFAVSNVNYWLGRGVPKNKAVLGVPFYGYGFGSASGEWPYAQIVNTYAGAENNDQAGSTIWYNGIPTIKQKTNYVFDQQLGGVMIWELSEDAAGAKSLLLAIDQVVKSRGTITPVPDNLAKGKPVTVSSSEAGANVASNAVDGSYGTRWSSLYSDAQWLTVDLGAQYSINRVKISWEAAYGKNYNINVSSDGATWTTIRSIVGNTSLTNDLTGLTGTCRYVSVNGSLRGTAYGYSIYELEVYGTAAVAVNQAPVVSITAPSNNATYAAPASVVITANATDSDGSIAKVDFYNGNTLLVNDYAAPFTYTLSNLAAGTYSITARATDNSGAGTTSSVVTITVNATSTNLCASTPLYVENGGYAAGSKVTIGGRQYICKPYPYSGWCNGAAWAYAPGTGSYWQDAWTDNGSCTARMAQAEDIQTSDGIQSLLSPNPVLDVLTFHFKAPVVVSIFNAQGIELVNNLTIAPEGELNLNGYSSGIYYLRIDNGLEVITRKIIKN